MTPEHRKQIETTLAKVVSSLDRTWRDVGSNHMGDVTELCLPNHPGFSGQRGFTDNERKVLHLCAHLAFWELLKSTMERQLDDLS